MKALALAVILLILPASGFCSNYAFLETLPTQHNGRVKPLLSLARETMLYITGGYSWAGYSALDLYLKLSSGDPELKSKNLINVRSIEVRKQLMLDSSRKHFSLSEIHLDGLEELVRPLLMKENEKKNSLSDAENKMVEVFHQIQVLNSILTGEHFLRAVDFSSISMAHNSFGNELIKQKYGLLISALRSNEVERVRVAAQEMNTAIREQSMPSLFESQLKKVDLEVIYVNTKLFFWCAIGYLILGFTLLFEPFRKKISKKGVIAVAVLLLVVQALGFGFRVYLTEFAPVTNMYGTMLWVAFGVALFSLFFFLFYKQEILMGLIWISCGLLLLFTENMPLILSPGFDPIVAVLRSNYWLTLHVLTITISYAAFTIAMIIGNVVLVRSFYLKDDQVFVKSAAHSAYRAIQLGVFLLSVGIILGGIWADYSWGRFWGWDPKETWALIADLGFLAILHARYIGWLKDFGLLASSPIAYLLVIMAWYGVNFILASGLHSYGFSSGGAIGVLVYVSVQLFLVSAAFGLKQFRVSKTKS